VTLDATEIQSKEISKPIQVLRWLTVLPGAIVCVGLAMFPIHWFVMLIKLLSSTIDDDSFITINGKHPLAAVPPEMLERFGYALCTPMIMIIAGAAIAPKYKLPTGIAMAVLWGFGFGASFTIAIYRGWYSGWGWLQFAITFALGIVGVALGLFQVHRAQSKKGK
jgi:hypothetical protein